MTAFDLVCWDFGDTLVEELFMRAPPPDLPEWEVVYGEVMAAMPGFEDDWMLGRASVNDLIGPLAAALPLTRAEVGRHLLQNLGTVSWFPDSKRWIERLRGVVDQAIVKVNPHEFWGIAYGCGLHDFVEVMVTSAELDSASKVDQARRARDLLGLDQSLATSLLIDNKVANVDEFVGAGGHGLVFEPDAFAADADRLLAPLLG